MFFWGLAVVGVCDWWVIPGPIEAACRGRKAGW